MSFIQRLHCIIYGRGQPLYSGQNGWSQCVLYSEVPLHVWLLYEQIAISHIQQIAVILQPIFQNTETKFTIVCVPNTEESQFKEFLIIVKFSSLRMVTADSM